MFWLALGYPLLAHLAVVFASPWLQWLALAWLVGISLAGALLHGRSWAWALWLGLAGLLWWLVVAGHGLYALYVPPAAIPLALMLLFASTLRAGQTPLITRIAALMHDGPLPDDLVKYTRHVTQLWVGVCAALFVSAVLLALFATPGTWSVMTNLVHYLVLGAVFLLEYVHRRMAYRHHEHPGFVTFIKRLVRTRIRI